MTPTDAPWNTLQMNHQLFWHLCLPFLFTLQMKRQKAFLCTEWDCTLICYTTGIFWCFSMWYFLFLSVRANVPDPNLLPNLTCKVHFYHLSKEETVLSFSSELATASKSIQFMIQKVQNCLICLLHTAKYFPLAFFFDHLSVFSKMSLWLWLKNKKKPKYWGKIHINCLRNRWQFLI